MHKQETELKKRAVMRLSNAQSNQLTRECIRNALVYLMNEASFDKITVTAIIKRSGVSRAAFYRNYTSKEDVLREIGESISRLVADSLTEERYCRNPRQWYEDCFRAIKENADIFNLLLQAKLPPVFLFQEKKEEQEQQEQQEPLPAKERYRRIALRSAVRDIVIDWFQNGMVETPEEMAAICRDFFP